MVLLELIFITVLLTLIAVAALSFRLFFHKDGKFYQGSCQPKLASESHSGEGCGCGDCGCGGGGGNK
jgi:hypothetical protein